MINSMELTEYFGERAHSLLKSVMGSSLRDPRESAFLMRFGLSLRRAQRRRESHEMDGLHVPMFLICSITSSCNLHCKGCYARANGTMVSGNMDLFMDNRNLIPVLSLEGGRDATDRRRGDGAFDSVMDVVSSLGDRGIMYGASVTVTTENQGEVLSDEFMDMLGSMGCRIVFLIEFVPSDRALVHLAPDEDMRVDCLRRVDELRRRHGMVIFSFPGDEAKLGGCLGAGRGFFHINPFGDAEACPASPYSDVNVRDGGLEGALRSDLFRELRMNELLSGEHSGGCVLLEREDEVQSVLLSVRK